MIRKAATCSSASGAAVCTPHQSNRSAANDEQQGAGDGHREGGNAIFGWFRRKQDPKQTRAYQMGQQAGDAFAADLESLMEVRFKPVHEAALGVIQGQFNKCLTPTDGPPLVVARIEYKIFLDHVEEMRGKMLNEIPARLSKWLDVVDQIRLRDMFMQLIKAKVDKFCHDLTEAGMQCFLDMAHALKLADDQWRVANPELSAKFPSEAL
jgi:hypothetical protein